MNARALLLSGLSAALPLAAGAQAMPLHSFDSGELGLEVMSLHYEAGNGGSDAFALDGSKVGLYGRFTQALPGNWFWGMDGRQSHGNANYDSASRGSKGANPDVITEGRITGGKDYPLGRRQLLAPYFGLGYRELTSNLQGLTSTGDAGYRRRSQYVYLPLGLTHRLQLQPEARLATTLEYDLLLEGRQGFMLSDTNAGSNDLTTTQRSGYGLRLQSRYETAHWSFGVFMQYWQVGASDLARQTLAGAPGALYAEPANTTREVGLQLLLRFN